MNSLYELDPKWKKLLQLDNFLDGLTVQEFVQGLCQSQINENNLATSVGSGTLRRTGTLTNMHSGIANNYTNGDSNKSTASNSKVFDVNDGSNINSRLDNLDPKPYIRTLESTLKELQKLENESNNKNNTLKQQVLMSELQHSEKVLEILPKFQNLTTDFNILDDELTKVNHVVSPLGSKLEKNIRSKNSYIESVLLIKLYQEFYTLSNSSSNNHDNSSVGNIIGHGNDEQKFNSDGKVMEKQLTDLNVPSFFKSFNINNIVNWKSIAKVVTTLRNLLILSHKLETKSLPKTVVTSNSIEDYANFLETTLLKNFNDAYRSNDFKSLNEIALILNYYNDGKNVIQSFINQHVYLHEQLQQQQLSKSEPIKLSDTLMEKLLDPDYHTNCIDEIFERYLEDLSVMVAQEATLVYKVFEDKTYQVMQLFLQTLFQQIIEPKINKLLNHCMAISNLAYCRMLHGLYSLLQKFLKELQEYFITENEGKLEIINPILESRCTEVLNKILLKKTEYFDKEKRSLETILFSKASNFNSSHEIQIKQKLLEKALTSKINTQFQDFSSSSTINNIGTTNFSNSAQKKIQSINTFFKSHLDKLDKQTSDEHVQTGIVSPLYVSFNESNPKNNNHTIQNSNTKVKDEFSLGVVDSMLKCFVESLARIMELAPQSCDEYSTELVHIVISGMVNQYIESGLEVSYFELLKSSADTFTENALVAFAFIARASEMLSLLSISIKSIILPILNNSYKLKKQVIESTNTSLRKVELMINEILNKLTALCSSKFSIFLSKQKKKDYQLRDGDIMDQDTLPVVETTQFLNDIYKAAISGGMLGENLTNFLNNVGHSLYVQLIDHYRKFSVNSIGGVVLTKDIIGYQTAIEKWGLKNSQLVEEFATLRELANIFTVQPNLVSSLVKGGHLVDVSPEIIGDYISKREDYVNSGVLTRLKINLR